MLAAYAVFKLCVDVFERRTHRVQAWDPAAVWFTDYITTRCFRCMHPTPHSTRHLNN